MSLPRTISTLCCCVDKNRASVFLCRCTWMGPAWRTATTGTMTPVRVGAVSSDFFPYPWRVANALESLLARKTQRGYSDGSSALSPVFCAYGACSDFLSSLKHFPLEHDLPPRATCSCFYPQAHIPCCILLIRRNRRTSPCLCEIRWSEKSAKNDVACQPVRSGPVLGGRFF